MVVKKLRLVAAVFAMIAASGCASPPVVVEAPKPDPAIKALEKSAASIAESYRQLAKIKQARLTKSEIDRQLQYDLAELPELWRKEVTVIENFSGPALEFLTTISALAGMKQPKQFSYNPARPAIVHINKGTGPLIDFIAEAGYQSQDSLEVRVSERLNQIIIKHKEL